MINVIAGESFAVAWLLQFPATVAHFSLLKYATRFAQGKLFLSISRLTSYSYFPRSLSRFPFGCCVSRPRFASGTQPAPFGKLASYRGLRCVWQVFNELFGPLRNRVRRSTPTICICHHFGTWQINLSRIGEMVQFGSGSNFRSASQTGRRLRAPPQ